MTRVDIERFEDLIDRHGADFTAWRDRDESAWARRQIMAEPQARAAWEAAKRLDAALAGHVAALDAALEASGATERIVAGVDAALPVRQVELRHWTSRVAAGIVVAGFLGAAFQHFVLEVEAGQFDVVMVDTLLYGPNDEVMFE